MSCKLIISAASAEQNRSLARAVEAALADHGVHLPAPDARPSDRREMFSIGEVLHYTIDPLTAVGVSVVANAIYARLKFLHPNDDIDVDPTGSGAEVVNNTSGARVEIDDGSEGE